MKYLISVGLVGVFSIVAMARPVPIGERKYVIPEAKTERVQIVDESEKIKGIYMRDPVISGMANQVGKTSKKSAKNREEDYKPTIVRTEKTFKPLSIEGRLLQPRVDFDQGYLDISQLEAISEPKFAKRLVESLDALE